MSPDTLDQVFVERVVAALIFAIGGRMFWGRYLFVSLTCYVMAALASAAAVWRLVERLI